MVSYAFKSLSVSIPGVSGAGGRNLQSLSEALFRSLERLKRVSLGTYIESNPATEGANENDADREDESEAESPIKDIMTEKTLIGWLGKNAYERGMEYYETGQVSQRKVSGLVLTGLVSEEIKASERRDYKVRIEFFRNKGGGTKEQGGENKLAYHHVSAWCPCLEIVTGVRTACGHIAALMISWVRENEIFDVVSSRVLTASARTNNTHDPNWIASELADSTSRVFSSLEGIVSFLVRKENRSETTFNRDILLLLENLHHRLKESSEEIRERWDHLQNEEATAEEQFERILGFSFVTNMVTSRILTAIDVSRKAGVMQIKNDADIGAVKSAIERFAQLPRRNNAIASIDSNNKKDSERQRTKSRKTKKVSRSWDQVIELMTNSPESLHKKAGKGV